LGAPPFICGFEIGYITFPKKSNNTNPTLKHAWQREALRRCTERFDQQASMILNED